MSIITINKDKVTDYKNLILSKKLSFTDVLSLIIMTLAYFLLLSSGDTNEAWYVALLVYRLGGIPTVFLIKSMLSKSYKPIGYIFQDGWDIINQEGLTDKEKINLLRDYLENKMERWLKYWIMFKTIVCSDNSWSKKWKQLKELFKEIYKGEMNLYQLIWLLLYYVYSILIATNILEIAGPYDLVVNLIFLAVIYYATGDLVGLGNILAHIFGLLTGIETEDDIKSNLLEIEKDIKLGTQVYYYYTADKAIETNNNKTIIIRQQIGTKEEVEAYKQQLEGLSQSLEGQEIFAEDKEKINGEIKTIEQALEQEKKE